MMKFLTYIFLSVALFLSSCVTDKDEPVWSLEPGESLPDFAVTLSDGMEVTTASLRGHTAVITFFNTECPDCRRELPRIDSAYVESLKLPPQERPIYICIAREEGEETISRFWEKERLTVPYSPQSNRTIYNLFASSGIPRVYVADKEGQIVAVYQD